MQFSLLLAVGIKTKNVFTDAKIEYHRRKPSILFVLSNSLKLPAASSQFTSIGDSTTKAIYNPSLFLDISRILNQLVEKPIITIVIGSYI